MLESAVGLHEPVENLLPGMPERRVPEIVGEHDRLRQILVQAQRASDGAGNLGALHRVGEPRPVVVALVVHEDLGLVFEAAKRRRMDDPVPVSLEGGAERVLGFGVLAAARTRTARRPGSEQVAFASLVFLPTHAHGLPRSHGSSGNAPGPVRWYIDGRKGGQGMHPERAPVGRPS